LIDGAYHVLFAVSELCESNKADPMDETAARANITQALDIVNALVKQESKNGRNLYYKQIFQRRKNKIENTKNRCIK